MSVPGVRRDKAALSSGCKPHPATATAGSNRSSHGGNKMAEPSGSWSHIGDRASVRAATRVSAPGDRQGVCGGRSHGRLDSDRRARQSEVAKPPTLETTMQVAADRPDALTAIQTARPAIFVSLDLSRSTWLITSLSPGAGEKMSKHSIRAGDVAGLLMRVGQVKDEAGGGGGGGA